GTRRRSPTRSRAWGRHLPRTETASVRDPRGTVRARQSRDRRLVSARRRPRAPRPSGRPVPPTGTLSRRPTDRRERLLRIDGEEVDDDTVALIGILNKHTVR